MRTTSTRRLRRVAGFVGIVTIPLLGLPAAGRAASTPALWAQQAIAIPGSRNVFCGFAHTNGGADLSGHQNTVSGPFEYVSSFKANPDNTVTPVPASSGAMPSAPHDLGYYRDLAQAAGTYFSGAVALNSTGNPWNGVIFSEQAIHVASGVKGTVTLVAANGEIHFDGSNNVLDAAVDGMLALAAQHDVTISGSSNTLTGSMFVPAGPFSCPGSNNSIAGSVVALTIAWPGSANQLGGQCCADAADCDDGKACTTDTCDAGACQHAAVPGCQSCSTAADCNDGNPCTDDSCSSGVCAYSAVPNCPVTPQKKCSGGLVDCTDPDCASAPECQRPHQTREICGDCIDNNGDGLVDGEDPDCCAQTTSLGVGRLMLKPKVKVRGTRLFVKARYATVAPLGFDPMTQDTELQISNRHGQMFCQTVAARNWKHPHSRVYKFSDKSGAFAGGLARGRFRVKRDREIMFRTRGKKIDLRPAGSGDVVITLRVGNQCAQSTASLRQAKTALVFP